MWHCCSRRCYTGCECRKESHFDWRRSHIDANTARHHTAWQLRSSELLTCLLGTVDRARLSSCTYCIRYQAFCNRWPRFQRCCVTCMEQPTNRGADVRVPANFSTTTENWTLHQIGPRCPTLISELHCILKRDSWTFPGCSTLRRRPEVTTTTSLTLILLLLLL